MQTMNIHEAKTQFSKLIEAVMNGEEVIIARAGKPVASLVAIQSKTSVRRAGALKGKITIADDFDAPLPDDVLTSFEGS
ncbi:MAG: type II toxin-antitoxin system Phd/YefM family antitoxin [Burkholderiaceae bacterium]